MPPLVPATRRQRNGSRPHRPRDWRWRSPASREYLYAADSFDDVLLRIGETAVSTVAGCRMASITVSEQGVYQTAATTDPAASAVDQARYGADEGPLRSSSERRHTGLIRA
jgi:hypothetical protein